MMVNNIASIVPTSGITALTLYHDRMSEFIDQQISNSIIITAVSLAHIVIIRLKPAMRWLS